MSTVTIRMLAKELNLSVATVSKALRDSYEINPKTKERVIELARLRNYIPNPYASSLRRKNSKTIGVVLPDVADSFFSLAVNGIHTVAAEKGYHALIYLTFEDFNKEVEILRDCQSGRVDGVLISVSETTVTQHHIHQFISSGIPLVFFDRACEDCKVSQVTTDDFDSCYAATELLIRKGCKRISFLGASSSISIFNKRENGFKKALQDHKIKSQAASVERCEGSAAETLQIIRRILKRKNRPDGIVASTERLATQVYRVAQEYKIHIPRQLKVISFTNMPTADILSPSLTTVTQPAYEMGRQAARLLFSRIEKPASRTIIEKMMLPSLIEQRASTS
jgi:LacI family transcriptional regulator